MVELQQAGKTYEEALAIVSREMGHRRPDITEHYCGNGEEEAGREETMSIQLIALEGIRKTMEDHGMQRCRFPSVHGRASFDVFFLADNRPFLLLFGPRGYPCSFDFPVNPLDFSVFPYMTKDDDFTLRARACTDETVAREGWPRRSKPGYDAEHFSLDIWS